MSIIFLPAILGTQMAAPILWAPGIFGFFLLEEKPYVHEIPLFRGRGGFAEGGGIPFIYLFIFLGDSEVHSFWGVIAFP